MSPSLCREALRRFGWDGVNDTLWGRNLRPLPDKREMDGSAAHVAGLLRSDADLLQACQQVFGRRPPADAEAAGA